MEKKTVRKKIESKVKKAPVRKASKPVAAKKEEAVKVSRFGLHCLKVPFGAHKRKKLLGRGSSSGHGKTSTRGSKGQTSRSGRDFYPGFEGGQTPLIRRMPKRGFTSAFKKEFQIVNLGQLNSLKDTNINPGLLEEKGVIKNKEKAVKILGEGELKNAVTISAHAFSKQAVEKIQKIGGKIEIINDLSS